MAGPHQKRHLEADTGGRVRKDQGMKDKTYAILALKEILSRALGAVETFGGQAQADLEGWDLEFATMSRDDQVEWLLQLFNSLIND